MTEIRMALLELLRKYGLENDVDFLRQGVRMLSQRIIELEVCEQVGAGRYERNGRFREAEDGTILERDSRLGNRDLLLEGCTGTAVFQ